ncbi:hypothetical protein RQP46_009182 [Phenoliferia psychrophenolica]
MSLSSRTLRRYACTCQLAGIQRPLPILFPSPTRRGFATRKAAPVATAPPAAPATKIETIPFLLPPDRADHTLETAAHAAFGVGATAQLIFGRILRRFGIHFEPPVRRLAFAPMLIPTWRVDLRTSARGVLADSGMHFHLTATDASLPGFKMPPLDQLAVLSTWGQEPVKFDRATHLEQHGLKITALPFTHSPLNLLANLAGLPRLNQQKYGISFDPTSLKTTLFAAYPLYLPIYLGEFAFSIYPAHLPEPTWIPNTEGLEVAIGGIPVDLANPPDPGALSKLAPQLNQLLVDGKALSIADAITEAEIESHPRVMAYSEFALEHIKAHEQLVTVEAILSKVESIPEGVRAISLSTSGFKLADGPTLKADTKKKLYKATKAFEVTKPKWLDELEKKQLVEAGARKSANGRPTK